jgi:hypothetical protein
MIKSLTLLAFCGEGVFVCSDVACDDVSRSRVVYEGVKAARKEVKDGYWVD